MTIDEILELIGEDKSVSETAEFLKERIPKDASKLSKDIADIFKTSGNTKNYNFWKDVSKKLIIDKNTDQDNPH